jgi:hypothetical protein
LALIAGELLNASKGFLLELCAAPHRTKMAIISMFAIRFDWKQLAVLIDIQLLF